jgi:hypothetical protein
MKSRNDVPLHEVLATIERINGQRMRMHASLSSMRSVLQTFVDAKRPLHGSQIAGIIGSIDRTLEQIGELT